MNRLWIKALVLLSLAVVWTACGPNYVVQQEQIIDPTGWDYASPVNYTFRVTDTTQRYDLHLMLDHATTFATQNFYVEIHTLFPSGEHKKDQVSLELANKFGQWYGKCGNESCRLDLLIQKGAYFNQIGEYQIEIA